MITLVPVTDPDGEEAEGLPAGEGADGGDLALDHLEVVAIDRLDQERVRLRAAEGEDLEGICLLRGCGHGKPPLIGCRYPAGLL